MATEIRMPRLGWTMEEGIFGEWLKHDGDAIQAGDFLFTIEGDKATQEIEAFDSGILRIPPNAAKPGDLITVGTVLAYTVRPGEAAPFEGQPVAQQPATQTVTTQPVAAPQAESRITNHESRIKKSPSAPAPAASPPSWALTGTA